MKTALFATPLIALIGLGAAGAASAEPEVRVRNAVARMVVIVEDRGDVAVEIEPGSGGLPAPTVTRRGDEVRIDGNLGRNSVRNCRTGRAVAPAQPGTGASVEVRGHGRKDLTAAPLIVVRTPRRVDVNIESGAVFGAIGRGATQIDLGNASCGDWTVANTSGDLELSLAGSGNVWSGSSGGAEVNLAGSGDISLGETRRLEVNIAGSGDVAAARVNGPVEVSIAGSGDVVVRGGSVGAVSASIAGSGDVRIDGPATAVQASIMGSGDVYVRSVSGPVSQSSMGSGRVVVGQ